MVYAPVAARLGLYYFKNLLEEHSFAWLEPEHFTRISGELANLTVEMDSFIKESEKKISDLLPNDHGYTITHRIKKPYSIYRKMKHFGIEELHEVNDVFALRVLVNTVDECYSVLGMIHAEWKPILENLRDYVGSPKPNGYQSIHTTVLGMYDASRRRPTEIQIRTYSMHEHAEYGPAAHFSYKEGNY